MTDEKPTIPQTLSKRQLCQMYKVDRKTLKRWLIPFAEQLGEPQGGRIYTPKQVKIIFENLGNP